MKLSTMGRAAGAGMLAVLLACPTLWAQQTVTFEQMVRDLGSEQPGVRLIAATALKQSAYPEAAAPLARAIVDPDDAVQFEAIAGELNIFLAEKIIPRKRVGLVIEVRNRISGRSVFEAGPGAIEPRPVPPEVIVALRTAANDENPNVALEALYTFGVLASELTGSARQQMLAASATEIAASVGAPQAARREAAVTVIGRVYGYRAGDAAPDESVGDAVVLALNDGSAAIRGEAMRTLGAMRYARAVQALTDLVQHHRRGPVAAAAFDALARIGYPTSRPLFDEMLGSRDAVMRRTAVEAVARLAAPADAQRISAVMADERSEEVRLAGHFAAVLLSGGPVDPLIDGLARTRFRAQAFGYLLEVAPGRAAQIGVHIQDPDARVRLDLVDILMLSRDEGGVPALERLLRDPVADVARAAGRAIVRLRGISVPPR